MTELIPIQVPFANANDMVATLVEWLVEPDAQVTMGQYLARMETTKTVIDVDSPATGRLECLAEAGAELTVGAVIGFVKVPVGTVSVSPQPSATPMEVVNSAHDEGLVRGAISDLDLSAPVVHAVTNSGEIRLSRRAQVMATRIGIDPAMLGLAGLVRTRDLLAAVERYPAQPVDRGE